MKKQKKAKKPATSRINEVAGLSKQTVERIDMGLGLVAIGVAVYLIVALWSFITTGAADQSLLEELRPGDFLNSGHEFKNYCGSLGAIVSYALMSRGVGLAAFALPVFLVLLGVRLTGAWKPNLLKWFLGLAVVCIWLSVFLSKFITPLMGSLHFDAGGDHGRVAVHTLENIMGEPGLLGVLLLSALIFLIVLSHETIIVLRKALNPVKFITEKIKFTVSDGKADEEEKANEKEEVEGQLTESDGDKPTYVDMTPELKEEKRKQKEEGEGVQLTDSDKLVTVTKTTEEQTANTKRVNNEVDLSKPINPLEPFTRYKYPPLDLLSQLNISAKPVIDYEEIKANNARIVEVLHSFGVSIKEIKATVGPTVTLYEITPAEGVRISRIRTLQDDIALSLSALGIRIIAPIPGKGTIGIEVPNKKPQMVSMYSILNTQKFKNTDMELPLALGKTITNELFMIDLAKIPHLLVAGATGMGKSVGLNCILTSLLYKKHPNELKIVLIDPKQVEFSIYNPIRDHFMAVVDPDEDAIITDSQKVIRTLNSLCVLMDDRYTLLRKANVRNVKEYNAKFVNHKLNPNDGHEYMPYIVVIIDEFGDLIMTAGKEIELPIARIAQKARAVGMHMIIATQRPTTNIITGTIKANFPGRMAFKVAQAIDSRTILDRMGAEQLIGRGDMLILKDGTPVRVQCAFVDTPEVQRINDYICEQPGPVEPLLLPEPKNEDGSSAGAGGKNMDNLDPLFEEAAKIVILAQQGSTSLIQRKLQIGFNRAGRIMDQMEAAGVVGATQGSKPREVLIQDTTTLDGLMMRLRGQM